MEIRRRGRQKRKILFYFIRFCDKIRARGGRSMQNKPKAPKRFVFLITQLVNRYFSHDVGRDSAALTYYLLFAIFPLLIFVSTLLGVLRLDIESILFPVPSVCVCFSGNTLTRWSNWV